MYDITLQRCTIETYFVKKIICMKCLRETKSLEDTKVPIGDGGGGGGGTPILDLTGMLVATFRG